VDDFLSVEDDRLLPPGIGAIQEPDHQLHDVGVEGTQLPNKLTALEAGPSRLFAPSL
jgi:hypothetical protein